MKNILTITITLLLGIELIVTLLLGIALGVILTKYNLQITNVNVENKEIEISIFDEKNIYEFY